MDVGNRIKDKIANSGSVNTSDISEAIAASAPVDNEQGKDSIADSENYKNALVDAASSVGDSHKSNMDLLTPKKEVVITVEDKERFLNSIITNTRFTAPFSLFGGRLKGVFRSKTPDEAQALICEIDARVAKGIIGNGLDYNEAIRYAMLRFQVAEINGVVYPEYEGELRTKMNFKTGEVDGEPEWMTDRTMFSKNFGVGILAALFDAASDFERKYWNLVEKAEDQSFWNPEVSM